MLLLTTYLIKNAKRGASKHAIKAALIADVVEVALAHVDGNQTRRDYNNAKYLEQRRIMMGWWSDYIEAAAMGNMGLTQKNSNVLQYFG